MRRWLEKLNASRRSRSVNDIVFKPRQAVVRLRERSVTLEISWANLLKLLRRHWARSGIGAAVVTGIVALVMGSIGRANIATLYATSCLGGWDNPQLAEGPPDVQADKPDAELFTSKNSAQLRSASAQVFCGGFRGDVPKGVKPKKVLLKLSWVVLGAAPTAPASGGQVVPATPAEAPPVVIEGQALPQQVESIIDSAESQSVELHVGDQPAPAPPPEIPPAEAPVPPPTPETSWLPWHVAAAFAQELGNVQAADDGSTAAATAEALESSSTLPLPTSTETISSTGTAEQATTAAAEPTEPPFLQVLYTLDGEQWSKLALVSAANWKDFSVELPLTSWDELATVQISFQTLTSLVEQPVVLLDSVRLEVEYEGDAASVQEQPDFAKDTLLQLLHVEPYYAMNIYSASRQRHEVWVYQAADTGEWVRVVADSDYAYDMPLALRDNTLFFMGLGGGTMNAYNVSSRTFSSMTVDPTKPDQALKFGSSGLAAKWQEGALTFSYPNGDAAVGGNESAEASAQEFFARIGGAAALVEVASDVATSTSPTSTGNIEPQPTVPVEAKPVEETPIEIKPADGLKSIAEPKVEPAPATETPAAASE